LLADIVESTLTNILLEESNLVCKFQDEKMDKEEPPSEDDELLQSFMRLKRPSKARVKANKMTYKTSQTKKK